jgi:hypothetical protein
MAYMDRRTTEDCEFRRETGEHERCSTINCTEAAGQAASPPRAVVSPHDRLLWPGTDFHNVGHAANQLKGPTPVVGVIDL